MSTIKIIELYNSSSNKLVSLLLSKSLFHHLVKSESNLLDMKLITSVNNNNILYTDVKSVFKFDFPEFIRNIVGNKSYVSVAREIFDLKNNTSKGIVKSKIFDLLKVKLTFKSTTEEIYENFSQKNITFTVKCDLPVINKNVEKVILKKLKDNGIIRTKIISDWIDNIDNKKKDKKID